jgi:2-dehydro-3-deoxy-D-gluconate 5-dehydrogenase
VSPEVNDFWDSFSLRGKNALVTGSRTGLGAAIAIGLAQAGANVVVHGRSTAGMDVVSAAIREAGAKAVTVTGDVAQPETCEKLVDTTVREFGGIDILINNAGIIRRAPAVEFSAKDWHEIIDTNLNAVFRLSQLAGRRMLERKSGKIVNIASMLSFQGGILTPAYAASKGGLAQLTKALANEWAPHGINVNAIAPGYMVTENTKALREDPVRSRQILDRIPAGRWGDPKDLAGTAVLLSSAASDYIQGHILVVDGGWLVR